MNTLRISQLAARVGVPATTLRFYEREGLLPAARTPAGHRQYTVADGDRVRFIMAAKHLGLALHQVRDLLNVRDGGVCRDVRDELRTLVASRVAAADDRIEDLREFRDRLTAALVHLHDLPEKDGPCEPACSHGPYLDDRPIGTETRADRAVRIEADRERAIACSLDGREYRDRLDEWVRLLDGAEIETLPDGGRAARLPADRADRVARLVAAEQRCCPFFSFRLDFSGAHIELGAHAPKGSEALVDALFDREAMAEEGCPC